MTTVVPTCTLTSVFTAYICTKVRVLYIVQCTDKCSVQCKKRVNKIKLVQNVVSLTFLLPLMSLSSRIGGGCPAGKFASSKRRRLPTMENHHVYFSIIVLYFNIESCVSSRVNTQQRIYGIYGSRRIYYSLKMPSPPPRGYVLRKCIPVVFRYKEVR